MAAVRPSARHLGGLFAWNGASHLEVQKRLFAINARWVELGTFLHSWVSFDTRRTVFLANVVGAALSDVISYTFTPHQFAILDTQLVKLLRNLLKGKAHSIDDGKHSALTNAQVLHRCGIFHPL